MTDIVSNMVFSIVAALVGIARIPDHQTGDAKQFEKSADAGIRSQAKG